MTAVVTSVVALACIAVLFATISRVRGSRFAFLAICWLPLAGLMFAVGAHHHLGYGMVGVLGAVVTTSIALVVGGLSLCAKAVREKLAVGSLVWGTMIAAAPLLIVLTRGR